MPLVSVITCTFNRGHLIGETIQSVLGQTFRDFEYIIIDDGSTDATKSVVENFRDPRISYHWTENTNGHLSKLRNMGIRMAGGKYVAYVDSDDIWLPEKLALQVETMERDASLGFSFTDVETFQGDEVLKSSIYNKTGIFKGRIFDDFVQNRFVICATTLLFRKSCLDKTGYEDERLKSGDFDFTLALATDFNALAIYTPLVRVRRHNQNFTKWLPSHKAEGVISTYQKVRDRGIISNKKLDRTLANLCYSFAVEFVRQGDRPIAIAYLRKSIGYNFLHWKSYVRLAMALFGLRY